MEKEVVPSGCRVDDTRETLESQGRSESLSMTVATCTFDGATPAMVRTEGAATTGAVGGVLVVVVEVVPVVAPVVGAAVAAVSAAAVAAVTGAAACSSLRTTSTGRTLARADIVRSQFIRVLTTDSTAASRAWLSV
jgi:hypothetical protein